MFYFYFWSIYPFYSLSLSFSLFLSFFLSVFLSFFLSPSLQGIPHFVYTTNHRVPLELGVFESQNQLRYENCKLCLRTAALRKYWFLSRHPLYAPWPAPPPHCALKLPPSLLSSKFRRCKVLHFCARLLSSFSLTRAVCVMLIINRNFRRHFVNCKKLQCPAPSPPLCSFLSTLSMLCPWLSPVFNSHFLTLSAGDWGRGREEGTKRVQIKLAQTQFDKYLNCCQVPRYVWHIERCR